MEPTGDTASSKPATEIEPEELLTARPPRRTPWARLLMRTLKVDGLDCPRCHARMVLLALITAPQVIERILKHLRLPQTPPPVVPARSPQATPEPELWDALPNDLGDEGQDGSMSSSAHARAPP